MPDNYDLLPDLARLLDAALRAGWGALPYVDRLTGGLGLRPSGGPEEAERLLREALGLPACGEAPGDPAGTLMDLCSGEPRTVFRDGDCLVIPALRLDAAGCQLLRMIVNGELPEMGARAASPSAAPLCEKDGEIIGTYGGEHYWQCGHPGTITLPSGRLFCDDHAGELGYGPKQAEYGYDPDDGHAEVPGQVAP